MLKMLPSGGRVIMFMTVQIRKFTIQSIHPFSTPCLNHRDSKQGSPSPSHQLPPPAQTGSC